MIPFLGMTQKRLQSRAGAFLIQNYTTKEYKGNAQMFGITQDSRGVIYFANQNGVLEYDGVTWRTITVGKDEKKVLTVETDENGNILVGAEGEFGILRPDSIGEMFFHSLLEEFGIDSVERVAQLIVDGKHIFLKSYEEIIHIYDGKVIERTHSETQFRSISYINKQLFAMQMDLGLFRWVDGKLIPVKGGYVFSNKEVIKLIEYKGRIIIITAEDGLYELKEKDQIVSLGIFEGIALFSAMEVGEFLAVGTFSKGVIALNQDLDIVYEAGIEKGVIDATVRCQYLDAEGNLWLGTNVGISKISLKEPILNYGKEVGIKSGIESISKFNDTYYFTTQNGIYQLHGSRISKIEGLDKDCYGIKPFKFKNDSLLLIAEINSVMAMDVNNNIKTIENGGPYDFIQSPLDSSELIVLHYDGISKLKYENGSFTEVRFIRNFANSETFNFIIDPDGTIWIGTLDGDDYGVYKGHVNMFSDSEPKFIHYGSGEGLPKGAAYLFRFNDNLYCANDEGVSLFNDGKFTLYDGFGFNFSTANGEYGVHRINADPQGNIWMVIFDKGNNYQIGYSSLVDGKYVWNSTPFRRYSSEIIHGIYHDINGITWLGGPNGLMRYDSKIKTDYDIPFNAIIRSVKYGDTIYYKGTKLDSIGSNTLTFKYSSNKAIGFDFSAVSFIDEKQNEFSYFLEGKDDTWSEWTKRTVKEYNLDHGDYIFHVKARNVYNNESSTATFAINILPPWYKTVWAYTLYFIAFVFFVFLIIKLSIRRVKQQNIRLEAIVEERTKEVVVQKDEAEKQRDFAHEQQLIAEHQKELVEEKNKEILDSIAYAKRLQDAILPPDKLVNEKLPNSFILYKPKDIVAGDFYWMESVDQDEVLFAAADCTGHGVPGAMVSVVCSNALDRTVKEFGIVETGKVLDKVTDLVIETFEKSEDEVKDGMDISLCKMRYEELGGNAKIQYAGANNPLWIISKREDIGYGDTVNLSEGGFHLHEIKATKQPVGQYAERRPFESHDLILEKGEIFYLFTDGFADQFGGDRGKKYKYKTFKRYLLANAEKSMKEQKGIIDNEFEMWKGEFEQVDDVCIIGVRI